MKAADGHEVYGISGGPIERFREGWAIIPFVHRPHYWRRRELTREYSSLCGLERAPWHPGIHPLAAGDFMEARCGHCQRKRQRECGFTV